MGADPHRPELPNAYFDGPLRGMLVDLVEACLQEQPGSDDSRETSKAQYAADILDPFFQRLAEACVENMPKSEDLSCFMLDWVAKQHGPEPGAIREFVVSWLEADLAEKAPVKLLQRKLDDAGRVIHEHDEREKKLIDDARALQIEVQKLRKENNDLNEELMHLRNHWQSLAQEAKSNNQGNLSQNGMSSLIRKLHVKENHDLKEQNAQLLAAQRLADEASPSKPPPRRPMPLCVNLILEELMKDPKKNVHTSFKAWAFFEPDESNQVDRDRFKEKVSGLDILTQGEVADLLDYVDYGGSGAIDYDEWKACLMMALAASAENHALPTEEEFNAVMFRIKAKLIRKGITTKQAFELCDFDHSGGLSHDEFLQGMLKLQLGLSEKEITQVFFSMDEDEGGELALEELEDAIEEGAEADTMKDVALPIFRQVGETLIQMSCMEKCESLATPPGSEMLSFDGFVQLMRLGHPQMPLSQIMRLWCIVDKCGKGATGFANIPDLVANILASTSTMTDAKSSFTAAGAA